MWPAAGIADPSLPLTTPTFTVPTNETPTMATPSVPPQAPEQITGFIFRVPPPTTEVACSSQIPNKTGCPSPSQPIGSTPTGFCTGHLQSKTIHEAEVPREISETVETFKKYVHTQKELSLEIATHSLEPANKVQADITSMKNNLSLLCLDITLQTTLSDKLKDNIVKCLRDVEMVKRVHKTPLELQILNTEPVQYFQQLAATLLSELANITNISEEATKLLQSSQEPTRLTEDELQATLGHISSSLVALAARMYSVHLAAEQERQHYSDIRRRFLDSACEPCHAPQEPSTRVGPTPFPAIGTQQTPYPGPVCTSAADLL